MKLLSCKVENFGSWKELEFDFSNIGLALVHGSTGSGKSTLLDIPPWCLFGITAKGGSVEEVRSWQSATESTIGRLTLQIAGNQVTICRIRGDTNKNDLFWVESGSTCKEIRGKDLNDTQKLLENRLAISSDIFLASSYYHEFSSTAAFFVAKAKERRELFENVCELRFPKRLAERCVSEKRISNAEIHSQKDRLANLAGGVESLSQQLSNSKASRGTWEAARLRTIAVLEAKSEAFEEEKLKKIKDFEAKSQDWEQKALGKVALLTARLKEIEILIKPSKDFDLVEAKTRNESRCISCGALPENIAQLLEKILQGKFENSANIAELKGIKKQLKELSRIINPYEEALTVIFQDVNVYLDKAKEAEAQENPFISQLQGIEQELMRITANSIEAKCALKAVQHRHASLSHLYDLSFELRGQLINTAIRDIQDETNRYLETYFDAELRVGFQSKDADNLEVSIQKSGYSCSYTQLSKGQRQLLRLSFSLAVMKSTANNSGMYFSTVMLDEALDGLDTNLKLKAFRLFQDLAKSHETVLVVDHSPELANLFETKFKVSMTGDISEVERSAA